MGPFQQHTKSQTDVTSFPDLEASTSNQSICLSLQLAQHLLAVLAEAEHQSPSHPVLPLEEPPPDRESQLPQGELVKQQEAAQECGGSTLRTLLESKLAQSPSSSWASFSSPPCLCCTSGASTSAAKSLDQVIVIQSSSPSTQRPTDSQPQQHCFTTHL